MVEQQASVFDTTLHTPANIDKYTESVQQFLQSIINQAVPWAKPSIYAKPFWMEACDKAIKKNTKTTLNMD